MKATTALLLVLISSSAFAQSTSWETEQSMLSALIKQSGNLVPQQSASGETVQSSRTAIADALAASIRLAKNIKNECKTVRSDKVSCVLSATGGDAEFTIQYVGKLNSDGSATILSAALGSID